MSDPFEVASDAELDKDYEIHCSWFVKAEGKLPSAEEDMKLLSYTEAIDLDSFIPSEKKNIWICPKFFLEGSKCLWFTLEYSVIKIFEDSKSEPLPLTFQKDILISCFPPFKISFDYLVNDWFTTELNNLEMQ